MANLGLTEIFGSDATTNIDPVGALFQVIIDLRNFVDVGNATHTNGEIQNGLGLSNLDSDASFMTESTPAATSKAYKIFYALLLLIIQNQAENINADPEQKIFIAEQSPRLGTGARSGQVQRSYLVSIFTPENITSTPDIDDI